MTKAELQTRIAGLGSRINVGVRPYTMWDAAKEEWPVLLLSGAVVVVALWVFLAWGRG